MKINYDLNKSLRKHVIKFQGHDNYYLAWNAI